MTSKFFEIYKKYHERKYNRNLKSLQDDFASRGLAQSGIRLVAEKRLREDYEDEIAMEQEKVSLRVRERRWRIAERTTIMAANIALALAAIGALHLSQTAYSLSLNAYKDTVETNKNLNRPYIDLDTKSVKENLIRLSEMIPVGENSYKERPLEKNLQFSIKNYGTLPAKFKVDFSDFRNSQFQTISQPIDIDYIYPDQAKELTFTYNYDSRAALERMSKAINEEGRNLFGNLDKINDEYIIKIKYGFVYQPEAELSFETIIRRKYFRVPCEDGQDLKNPNVACWRHKWIVERAN